MYALSMDARRIAPGWVDGPETALLSTTPQSLVPEPVSEAPLPSLPPAAQQITPFASA